MSEAEEQIAAQERWGLTLTDMAVVRLVRLVKVARGRLVDLEARVRALEEARRQ